MVNLQIPLLFDISAGGIVFGEDVSGTDLFDAHLNFTVVGDSADDLRGEFEKILYADASENDISGALFYAGVADGTSLSESLSKQISASILSGTGTLVQPNTATAFVEDTASTYTHGARYMTPGIPLPNYGSPDLTDASSNEQAAPTQAYYTAGLCDAAGTSFGRILIRLMATHLMGHPFAQSFIANEETIITDISNSNVESQVEDKLFLNDAVMFPDTIAANNKLEEAGVASNGVYGRILKTKGIRNQILQSIYEALLGTAPERFDLSNNDGTDVSGTQDVSGGTDADMGNLDPSYCRPRALPFREGDTMAFYFRPRVRLSIDSAITGGGASYGNDDLSGVGQGVNASANQSITSMFFNPRHRWIAHKNGRAPIISTENNPKDAYGSGLAANKAVDTYTDVEQTALKGIAMTGTDLVLGTTKGQAGYAGEDTGGTVFDGHCWKVILTF